MKTTYPESPCQTFNDLQEHIKDASVEVTVEKLAEKAKQSILEGDYERAEGYMQTAFNLRQGK